MTNGSYFTGAAALFLLSAALVGAHSVTTARSTPAPALSATFRRTGRPLVLVVVRLRDCSTRIEGLRQLNRLAISGDVDVRGVVLDAGEASRPLAAVFDGSGIRFPMSADSTHAARRLSELSGHATTPLLLVFDKRGALLTMTGMATTASLWSSAELDGILELARSLGNTKANDSSEVQR